MNRSDQTSSQRVDLGAARRAKTREKLLSAAVKVVADLGESRARIEDFISAAGISRGTFYNYYSTREELLDDLWAHVGSETFQDIQQASRAFDDPAERFAAEARYILERASKDNVWGWLIYGISFLNKVPDDLLTFPSTDLVIGHHSGRFKFDNLTCANDMIVCVLRRALRRVLEEDHSSDYASGMVELLLKALGLPDDEAKTISTRPLEG